MQVRVRHESGDAQVVAIIDLEDFSTSSPHRDLVLSGNLNQWRTDDDQLRFPWNASDDGASRGFLPLRVEVPRHLDTLEFKLYDCVNEEWLEPTGYLQGAYRGMDAFLADNGIGGCNVRLPLTEQLAC